MTIRRRSAQDDKQDSWLRVTSRRLQLRVTSRRLQPRMTASHRAPDAREVSMEARVGIEPA